MVPKVVDGQQYGNTGCRVFKRGVQNGKDFCLRNNMLTGNYVLTFENCCSGKLSKIGHHFSNKVTRKLILLKKCAPKLVFVNKQNIEIDSDYFWCRKLIFKVKFCHFSTLFDTSPLYIPILNNFYGIY